MEVCAYGHPMTSDNVYEYVRADGGVNRSCRICIKRRNDESNAKATAERAAHPPQPTRVTCANCFLDFTRPPMTPRKYCSAACAEEARKRAASRRRAQVRSVNPEGARQRKWYEDQDGDPIELAAEALSRECPTCGVAPGDACLNQRYQPTTRIHPERYEVKQTSV